MLSTHLRRTAVVLAAAVLLTGCGDSSDDTTPTDTTPSCGPRPSGMALPSGPMPSGGPGGPGGQMPSGGPGGGGPGGDCGGRPSGAGGGAGTSDQLEPEEQPTGFTPHGTDLNGAGVVGAPGDVLPPTSSPTGSSELLAPARLPAAE